MFIKLLPKPESMDLMAGTREVRLETIPVEERGLLKVRQRGFGYLVPGESYRKVGSANFYACIGVYVAGDGMQALVHTDNNFFGYWFQTHQFLSYLQGRGLLDKPRRTVVVRSGVAREDCMEQVLAALKIRGHSDIELVECELGGGVVANNGGEIALLNREARDLGSESAPNAGLVCENTERVTMGLMDEIFPGVRRVEYHDRGDCFKWYMVRVPVVNGSDPAVFGRIGRGGVKTELRERGENRWVEVSGEVYMENGIYAGNGILHVDDVNTAVVEVVKVL